MTLLAESIPFFAPLAKHSCDGMGAAAFHAVGFAVCVAVIVAVFIVSDAVRRVVRRLTVRQAVGSKHNAEARMTDINKFRERKQENGDKSEVD